MKKTNWVVLPSLVFVFACGGDGGGGGSGVSGTKKLVDLTSEEIGQVCEWGEDVSGPERTIDCGDGVTVTVGGDSAAECSGDLAAQQEAYPDCPVTVDQMEACAAAFAALTDEEVCSDTSFPEECVPLFNELCGPA